MPRLSGIRVLVALVAMAVPAQAATLSFGDLVVTPLGTNQCPGMVAAVEGELVQVTGDGYDANGSVSLEFMCCGTFKSALGSATARIG